MNLLNKLTIKNLKLNKKRTIVTIIGIMLSVALITAVATMYSSMIKTLINFEVYEKGDFHVAYYNVPLNEVIRIKNTNGIEDTFLVQNIGYAKLDESKNRFKPYIYVKGFTKKSLDNLSVKLIEGRLPLKDTEIVIPSHLKTNGRVDLKVGDTITLDIGKRVNEEGKELSQNDSLSLKENGENACSIIDTETYTYTIVGIIERPASNIEDYSAPGYTFITYVDEKNLKNQVDVYTKYDKEGAKNYLNVTATILETDEEIFTYSYTTKYIEEDMVEKVIAEQEKEKYDYYMNSYLMMLENKPLSSSTVGELGIVVAIVIAIILATSILCIRNSFDISITEKIKQYGMLRSIGATKKQIKKNVFYEATILGLIGIPLGLLLGLLASYILIIICNIFLKDMISNGLKIVLSFNIIGFLVSIILGLATIYLSAFKSATKASKVSPIDSIRNSANIKIKSKKIKCPKLISKIFKIGGEISYKNMRRNKKKYRTTVISIFISSAIFIDLTYFISSAFLVINEELNSYDYNINIYRNEADQSIDELAMKTVYFDNINDYSIERYTEVNLKSPKFGKEYVEIGHYNIEDLELAEMNVKLVTIGEHQYKKFLNKLKLDYNEYQDKAILNDYEELHYSDKGEEKSTILRKYGYKEKEYIEIINEDKEEYKLEIGTITREYPFGNKYIMPTIIVSDSTFDKIIDKYNLIIFYDSSNPNKLQDDIEKMLNSENSDNFEINNVAENARMTRNLYILVAIFLYGFIIVITLIGITNIFNTITTSMELRKQEFAMLKSIGMTKHEFNNMIRFETIFIGFKALFYGIISGSILSFLMYIAFDMKNIGFSFILPYKSIIACIIAVYLLIIMLMKYSLNKINKQNTIEVIRNENI